MTMEPTNRAALAFRSTTGEIIRFSIPRARMNKTTPEATETMAAMISNGAIVSARTGVPASIHSAKLITTTRRVLLPQG